MDAARVQVWAMQREEIPKMMASLTVPQRELAELIIQPLIKSAKHRQPSPVIF